jgi:hypothetical protein
MKFCIDTRSSDSGSQKFYPLNPIVRGLILRSRLPIMILKVSRSRIVPCTDAHPVSTVLPSVYLPLITPRGLGTIMVMLRQHSPI